MVKKPVTFKFEPLRSTKKCDNGATDTREVYLWMSDYHPDGGQLFWPVDPICPFVVCLGKNTHGDDVKPVDMQAFLVPAGKSSDI